MITAAQLKAAHDALEAHHPALWFYELTVDGEGRLVQPTHPAYFLLRLTTDPSVTDFDGEAYSLSVLTVQAWSTSMGGEYAVRDTAVTALAALGWERINTQSIPGDNRRFGLTTDFQRTT